MEPKLSPQIYNELMLDLVEVFGSKLKDRALSLFLDSYYEELKTMPTDAFLRGVRLAISSLPHQRSSFPTTKQIKELGYGCTDEQRATMYQEMDKSRILDVSNFDKDKASQQLENLNLLGKCVSLGIPQKEIAATAANGSLRELIKKYAPGAAMGRKEIEVVKSNRRRDALQLISQWRAEGTV